MEKNRFGLILEVGIMLYQIARKYISVYYTKWRKEGDCITKA